ncbi:tetratricopeptide repeat protein [Chryseobacterium sp. BIGb0232]|uniref:tetratricopeptide repeat protein n=1 Tax=Chryseobacterium sp. BIGb0232 TaxID=2940598 RepID=UPI000F497354|nr:tetratricopeptide repeat protein [Chryseobacterium sp. BIGb0232]MCS4305616.1 tetratricopeptide (TPR) repeat protein [Chryseobacterium sp. BIGb0232]ROS20772.1 tetratricopeptide repeat protein [Chryseobacterium nakagawai]
MNTLHQEAIEAFRQQNYAVAAKNWIKGHALPDDREELKEIYLWANSLNETSPDSDLCSILGLIALDHHDIFTNDREKALLQCIVWSKQGISISPNHPWCHRHAGSAFYWMNQWEEAVPYYEKAISLVPSPTLQVRLFTIKNKENPNPDFLLLDVNPETTEAMEAYNAGVEINRMLNQYPQMSEFEKERLTQLKRDCYAIAYRLYHKTLVERNGDPYNEDPHTFAMCCNNLAIELTNQEKYDEAITVTTEGMRFSYFIYILQNRFNAHLEAGNVEEAVADGEKLMEDFIDGMDSITYFTITDQVCSSYMELKDYESATEWLNAGMESYYSLDATDSLLTHPEIVRCFTNFYIYKAKIEEQTGIKPNVNTASQEADSILEEMPDNPSILISRSNIFLEEENYGKALECLQYAIHFASEQNKKRSLQVALYNMGYIQVAKLQDETAAFESFEQSIALGNEDFWCYYWAVHCGYHLQENEKTVEYALLALQVLPQQEGVTKDIIAEVYEHIGTAQLDLGQYADAAENLKLSLQYNHSPIAEDNLKTAEAENKRNSSGGFFKKMFGK